MASRLSCSSMPPAFSTRIAGEVKNFDPLLYIDKKEVKKMGRFIQFAVAASEFAMQSAGLGYASPEEAENIGVYIGSGIGGFEVIERETPYLSRERSQPYLALLYPFLHRQSGERLRFHQVRSQRPQFSHRHRLHHQRSLHRRLLPPHPARLRRRDDRRRE